VHSTGARDRPDRHVGEHVGVHPGPRPTGFADDVDAAAAVGLSLESFTYLTEQQFEPGQLAELIALEPEVRAFVLRVLGDAVTEDDWRWFNERDDCKAVAAWMLQLPGLRVEPEQG
jgi:hypothetical protein